MSSNDLIEIEVSEQDPDYLLKIVIVGDSSVGKSCILTRYTKNTFDNNTTATVGVELSSKLFKKDQSIINVHLWDTAGQERFASITNAYYKGANGAVVVYDITRRATFENVDKWMGEIRSMCPDDLVIFLVGNKSDLVEEREVTTEEGIAKAKMLNASFIEASAKDSTNVNEVFKREIMEIFLKKIKENYAKIEDREVKKDSISNLNKLNYVNLKDDKRVVKKKGCC